MPLTQPSSIIYLDETWFNQHDYETRHWLNEDEFTGCKTVIGKGKRLVIVHAGSRAGFVKNGFRAFWSDGKKADYHESMDAEFFEQWFAQLLSDLPESSVIVMDNASYHSRQVNKPPSSSSKKADIIAWLLNNQINFEQDMLKVELLELVKKNREATTYAVDKMAEERGHQVVRLPPYHCTFNPIEMIWAQLKGFVRSHNRTGRQADIMRLVEMAVETVTPHSWEKCCQHVLKVEEDYWRSDHLMEDVGPFLIDLQTSDESSDEE